MEANGVFLMSGSDLRRFRLVQDVIDGRRTQIEVSEELDLCVRQIRRLQRRIECSGAQGISHALRGKKGNRTLDEKTRLLVLSLWESKYRVARLNFTHFSEKLNEVEGVKICKETVRRILRKEGVAIREPKKGRKHRRFRERKPQFGELLQQDTSPHDWLSTGQKNHLVVIVDDATSKLLFCRLFEHDGTVANMIAMKTVFLKFGLPMANYTDRASWFFYTPKFRTADGPKPEFSEVDKNFKTQIGRALDELGVELIPAYSAQAKGRVERANGTLQNRLIAELRLQKITDINLANEYIEKAFIDDYNKRFSVEPQSSTSAFVSVQSPEQLDEILCLKFSCKVAKDNTVTRAKYFKLQLESDSHRLNWHLARVEVRMYLDGSVRVVHQPSQKNVPHTVIELKHPHEPKNPSELPVTQRVPA